MHTHMKEIQDIINRRFPTVILRPIEREWDDHAYYAFMIPDDKSGEFTRFLLSAFIDEVVEKKIPYNSLMPFTESETRRCYPEVLEGVE